MAESSSGPRKAENARSEFPSASIMKNYTNHIFEEYLQYFFYELPFIMINEHIECKKHTEYISISFGRHHNGKFKDIEYKLSSNSILFERKLREATEFYQKLGYVVQWSNSHLMLHWN